MTSSFRLYPNDLKSGDGCYLYLEGISDPDVVVNKKCIVRLYEIDKKRGQGESPGSDDLLAEFETAITKGHRPHHYYFDSAKTKRVDSYPDSFPKTETLKDGNGSALPVGLECVPPHLLFALDHGGVRPAQTDYHTVLIRGESNEVELMVFEIGFSIQIEKKELFNSFKMPTFLDCSELLAENCAAVAVCIRSNHENLRKKRSVGTHYGNLYPYAFVSEQKYLEKLSRIRFGHIDQSWINANKGVWDDVEKKNFDSIIARFGLEETSCIGYVEKAMKLGYEKTGMSGDWKQIWSNVRDERGDLLAKALVQRGWLAIYYNPDVNHPEDDGPPGSQAYKDASEHTHSYKIAKENKKYYGIKISDMLLNYYPTQISSSPDNREVVRYYRKPDTPTPETKVPKKFSELPFGFIIGRGGSHTAMIIKGKIYEVHWDVGFYLNDPLLFDKTDFINEWVWNSGVIVVPQSYWPY